MQVTHLLVEYVRNVGMQEVSPGTQWLFDLSGEEKVDICTGTPLRLHDVAS